MLTFDITFNSKIRVESTYRNGLPLFQDVRTVSAKIYSNTPFQAYVENKSEQDRGYELLKFIVNKTQEESLEYTLNVIVPREITHDFSSDIILVHPVTNAKTIIPVTFENRAGSSLLQRMSSSQRVPEREDRGEHERTLAPHDYKQGKGYSFMQIFLIFVFICFVVSYFVANCANMEPLVMLIQFILIDLLDNGIPRAMALQPRCKRETTTEGIVLTAAVAATSSPTVCQGVEGIPKQQHELLQRRFCLVSRRCEAAVCLEPLSVYLQRR